MKTTASKKIKDNPNKKWRRPTFKNPPLLFEKISQVLPCSNFDCSPCVYLFLILHAKSLWPFDQFNYITCLPRLLDRFTVWQFLTFENGRFDQSVTNKKLKYPVLQVWRFVINKIWDSWSGGTPLKRKVFQDFFLRLGFGSKKKSWKTFLFKELLTVEDSLTDPGSTSNRLIVGPP